MSIDTAVILDEDVIAAALGQRASHQEAMDILQKAEAARGLTLEEVAVLLQADDDDTCQAILQTARTVKERIYGKRLVLFAPLYLSNYCANDCLYCSFRRSNTLVDRKCLADEEIVEQVRILERMGHKRLLVEAGEHPTRNPIDYVTHAIALIYKTVEGNGSIRRVNVNIAATTVENYSRLKTAGIGTYQLFQETYHRPTYDMVHPVGLKRDYDYHLTAMDRAMEGGIDDVGIGVLFGLYDYRFETLALLQHAQHLERKFGVGPHTISVPRWRPAVGVDFAPPYRISDRDFTRLVAILRLAVPYTGIILSTRESPGMRNTLIELGISQLSAGSCTSPGGYREGHPESEQFQTADHRSLDEVVREIALRGYIPSFCTGCYRRGRTGETFMDLAKPGDIQELCQPNALLTFQEYLIDYASAATREAGEAAIARHLQLVGGRGLREETVRRLDRIAEGQRDLYF